MARMRLFFFSPYIFLALSGLLDRVSTSEILDPTQYGRCCKKIAVLSGIQNLSTCSKSFLVPKTIRKSVLFFSLIPKTVLAVFYQSKRKRKPEKSRSRRGSNNYNIMSMVYSEMHMYQCSDFEHIPDCFTTTSL